jgi:hypothetical protein
MVTNKQISTNIMEESNSEKSHTPTASETPRAAVGVDQPYADDPLDAEGSRRRNADAVTAPVCPSQRGHVAGLYADGP